VKAPQMTVALGRRLTSAQAERRDQLVQAARELATSGGYAAVTISAVCTRAGVARATFYHYFGSKDHVLGEVLVQWGRERIEELRRHPPTGRSALERVAATLRRVMAAVMRDMHLIRAHLQAVVSPDLGVNETQRQLASLIAGYVEAGLGSSDGIDLPALNMLLGHVFFSSLVNMAAGRMTADQVMDDLTTTATLLLEPATAPRSRLPGGARLQAVGKRQTATLLAPPNPVRTRGRKNA